MPQLRQYNIFISHAWAYDEHYQRLENLLSAYPNFKIVNYSAPKTKPLFSPDDPVSQKELKAAITEKIKHAQIVIIISGMWTDYRKWIQYEIDEALRMGKPILSVKPHGHQRMPGDVEEYSNRIVNWNSNSIITAIREMAM